MTPTAQQLWDQTVNYRREGGPGMPDNFKLDHHYAAVGGFHLDRPCWMDTQYRDFDLSHAAAILRDHGLRWLVEQGGCPQLHHDDKGFSVDIMRFWDEGGDFDFECFHGPTMLAAVNSAIGAVLAAKEGR